jgi:hypothetical protein
MKLFLFALAFFGLTTTSSAEIEKIGEPCETGICLYCWPKLPAVAHWHHERGPSLKYGANTLARDGTTFMDADTVMYAKALYKPRIPGTTSLDVVLMNNDKEQFVRDTPVVKRSEVKALKTGDGQILRSFTFFPATQGNWERVSYGEEDDFYLIFTISSRTKSGYDKALPAYEAMINAYRKTR